MKSSSFHRSKHRAIVAGAILAGSLCGAHSQAISDDFNDGNDAGWTRYDTIATGVGFAQGTWSFPSGGYRMQAAASPAPGVLGPARIGSLRSEVYSDFYVAVDVVSWDDSIDQSFGPFARLTNVGLGSTKGYVMTYQAGGKDIDITRITGEASERSVRENGNGDIALEPGRSYRFVFIGKGALLTARVYELSDLVNPIVEISGTDPDPYPSGVTGLLVYDNSDNADSIADATFDNYFTSDVEPPALKLTDLTFGDWELSWPGGATDFVLQSSLVIPGTEADWTEVSTAEIIAPNEITPAYRYYFGATPENGGRPSLFFRLVRRPPGAN